MKSWLNEEPRFFGSLFTWLIVVGALVGLLMLSGCAGPSPFKPQADALKVSYEKGELSASDYHARMNELYGLELQRRMAISQAWGQFGNNMQNQFMQQQMINQMNRPQTIWLYRGN
ncbi:MAG: hypothetical protein EHM49_10515 [Deltaproteobacteria bacterium]|nr:MAG: hypothetical protein EHM49_10515 [Deltaproteobacteria bacterium]